MRLSDGLSIVIPAKNEEKHIGVLLDSIARQDIVDVGDCPIIVADAGSSDGTVEEVFQRSHFLNVSLVPGGLPAAGRNRGADTTTSKYILFIDADMELGTTTVLGQAVDLAECKNLDCITVDIKCRDGRLIDNVLYGASNILQRLSVLHKPYATGMFMLVRRSAFEEAGRFDEKVLYAEDYHLSRRFKRSKFSIGRGFALTTNRRFKKMGAMNIARMFLATLFGSGSGKSFMKDRNYWD